MNTKSKPVSENPTAHQPLRSFREPRATEWHKLDATEQDSLSDDERKQAKSRAEHARDRLEQTLLAALKMEHVMILAGSGCSYGVVGSNGSKGPSMTELWNTVVGSEATESAKNVADRVQYNIKNKDIEAFLSQIEGWLSLMGDDTEVSAFLKTAKQKILEKCGGFIEGAPLTAHKPFLHRLSRRRVRDQRLKVFTTNYDLCFERAAAELGCIPIDGFSFSNPRHYDPRFFDYDIIRRTRSGDKQSTYLEGVFQLYKLHGSVNWEKQNNGAIKEVQQPDPERACLIYPASGKYQKSYDQPYLESISQYLAAIREPNTCVLVVGFGFNDDHLSQPLLSSVQSNPHLRVIIVDPSLQDKAENEGKANRFHSALFEASESGEDVWFVNATFDQFAELIPDLKSLTPPERLFLAVQGTQKGVGHD
jgi:hypothetical protein